MKNKWKNVIAVIVIAGILLAGCTEADKASLQTMTERQRHGKINRM